jgi:oxygen-independent coproporphyrinogen-3 oxidase
VGHVRHLYVHLPFCAHRCGYCDFVTVVGRRGQHATYVDALLAELALERDVLADRVETVFLGGGTPTFTEPRELERLLAALPPAREVTVEANPETVTAEVAALLRANGVTRVSLGAQSFQPHLLDVLERQASPEDVRSAARTLRDAGFANISLDLIYGIPGQSSTDLAADLAEAVALEPEHLSCYELEAKPGTRFTHAHGKELARQADALEGYFEQVVDTLTEGGYRWYETANFCVEGLRAGGRDLRAQHNLGYWQGRDYLGLGIGAVSTVAGDRHRNLPSLARYVSALAAGDQPPREVEPIDHATHVRELLLLGLRLDEPLATADVAEALDRDALARLVELGLVETSANGRGEELRLTRRGRFLGGGVTADLMA